MPNEEGAFDRCLWRLCITRSSSRRPSSAWRLASFMIHIKFQLKTHVRQTILIQAWIQKKKKKENKTEGLSALLIAVVCIAVFVWATLQSSDSPSLSNCAETKEGVGQSQNCRGLKKKKKKRVDKLFSFVTTADDRRQIFLSRNRTAAGLDGLNFKAFFFFFFTVDTALVS